MRSTASSIFNLIAIALFLATSIHAGPALAETICIEENAGSPGMVLLSQSAAGAVIHYEMDSFGMEPLTINGEPMKTVSISGAILPNAAGAPNLPGLGRYIALPQGATASLEIVSSRTRTYNSIEIAPAPIIPRADDDSPLVYDKDPSIYGRRAFYPESPARLSEPSRLRGIDVVILAISPFRYNPVTKELIVYTQLDLRIDFHGGNGRFGEDRLRSRYWEPILQRHVLNYGALPLIDFSGPRAEGDGYEYVIITPDDSDFIAWGDTLKAWRKLQGISSEVFTTTDIGGTSWTVIRDWLCDAYENWDPAPAAFLILGDYPESGQWDQGVDAPIWNNYCVSDNIYADTEGNDDLPEMAHGRITARNAEDLATMIGKMLSYEREPYTDQGFYDHPVISGGWQTDRWYILCCEVLYGFQEGVLGKAPVREYAIAYGTPGSLWSTGPNTQTVVDYFGPDGLGYIPATPEHLTDWGANAARINNDINTGAYFVFHRDHGRETLWEHPEYNVSDLPGLYNDMYPFVFSINCLTGKYDWPGECFVEAFHRMDHGALGIVAASGTSFSFVNDAFTWGMFDALWPEFDPGYPDLGDGQGGENIGASDFRMAFAMIDGKYYLEESNWPFNTNRKVHTYHLFHHHGDAFMQMYSEVPQHLTVSHDDICPVNQDTFTVQANEGAVIALTAGGEIIGVADAIGAPLEIAIVPQTEPGDLRIVVTKANYFRYDVTIPIDYVPLVVRPDGTGDCPTIQAAIDAAVDGMLILLADGTFSGQGNRDLDYHGKAITVRSESGQPVTCAIDCQGSQTAPHRGVHFHSGEGSGSVLEGVTIMNGYAERGGAIRCDSVSAPTILGCHLSDNSADSLGAGMSCALQSSPTITNCTFSGNTTASLGGGIGCELEASPTLTDCTFFGNLARAGGAMSCGHSSSPVLINCTLSHNSASNYGGGVLCASESSPTFENTIIAFSSAGEAVYCIDTYLGTGAFTCCDVYGNAGGDWIECIAAQHGVSGNFSLDPCFCDPEVNDYQLWNYSPCVQELCGLIGAWHVGCLDSQDADEDPGSPEMANTIRLANRPNPFGSFTRITYTVPAGKGGTPVVLSICEVTGRLVRTLVNAHQDTGTYSVSWDGTAQVGEPVENGIYFYRLSLGGEELTGRMLLVNRQGSSCRAALPRGHALTRPG